MNYLHTEVPEQQHSDESLRSAPYFPSRTQQKQEGAALRPAVLLEQRSTQAALSAAPPPPRFLIALPFPTLLFLTRPLSGATAPPTTPLQR
ncbi:hypothetical protein Anapl_07658 [Anas platyrhynchos]|uniref:Uncharacterized protein n=1 Tax=Anas platyrhynchos TaxID=8839 RepID=R0LZP7_ANAPL|nr:hypothetical protein Anapl_07658 [Anas platyrhynchos]